MVWVGWHQQLDQTWRRLTRSFYLGMTQLISEGQRGSETMSRSSHHHHDLAHSFRGAALDDIQRLRFRHRRATATSTRLVSVCHQQVLQPKRSAPVSVLYWRSRKLTRKAGGPQLVENYAASSAVVEMTWIKALRESMTWKDFDILTQRRSSRPLKNHDAACDTKRKSSLL